MTLPTSYSKTGPARPLPGIAQPSSRSSLPGWSATAAIIASLLILVGAGLLRGSWMPPALTLPAVGPPWELAVHVSPRAVVVALWVAGLLGLGGVIGGLVATRRGLPIPVRTLLVTAVIAVIALLLLPPIGSTDTLDYSIYGHIVALGHSPYVMTPVQYKHLLHLHTGVPRDWAHAPSVYGPLATGEQFLAAKLGGANLARDTFWLKLWNAIAFGAIAIAADRLQRGDRAGRARVHLLWMVNPLVIWAAIAGGHIDVVAAAVGLAGLLILDRRLIARPLPAAIVAGLCVGAATDIKAVFALYGLAIGWALRRKPAQLLAATAGAAVVIVPSYLLAGRAAIKALTARASTGLGYGFYGPVFHRVGISLTHVVPVAICLLVPIAWLALQRFPAGLQDRPAVRAALALSLAWLLLWPHQFAWYSLMAVCLLAFYPASRLDWLGVAWLGAMTIADMPGVGTGETGKIGHTLLKIQYDNLVRFAPLIMLVVLVTLVTFCINGRWHGQDGGLAPLTDDASGA